MLDMGNLTISNTLKKLDVVDEHGKSPTVDEMNIQLQNLKLSRYHSEFNQSSSTEITNLLLLQGENKQGQVQRDEWGFAASACELYPADEEKSVD